MAKTFRNTPLTKWNYAKNKARFIIKIYNFTKEGWKIENQTGRIFNIQHFCIHDGPGIREMVFFKGCPLHCPWCANPESQSKKKQLLYREKRCIHCGYCIAACPSGAIALKEEGILIDRERCEGCFQCVKNCCTEAITCVGEDITPQKLAARIQKQRYGWRGSDGVTLSGGEPLMQPEFAVELLKLLKEDGVNTAVETSAYADYPVFRAVASLCDTVFCDVKLMDDKKHKKYTGVGNQRILCNIRRFSQEYPDKRLIIRTPLLPGINDGEDNLEQTVGFINTLHHVSDFELLPYHPFGTAKYVQLGMEYQLPGIPEGDKEAVKLLNDRLRRRISCLAPDGKENG